MSNPTEPNEVPEAARADGQTRPERRLGRGHRLLGRVGRVVCRLPHPSLHSKRGLFVLFLLMGGFGSLAMAGAVMAVHYTETSSFCGRCHTMGPELKAYAMSPHKELTCAECHVAPGVSGWVKAKANGTKQLIEVLTNSYPRPIPPPEHARLPSVKDTCLRCHSLDNITKNGGPVKLVLRLRYRPDERNTREMVVVVLRPAGLGQVPGDGVVRGVHWHVQEKVSYASADIRAQRIDLVEVLGSDGAVRQYLAGSQVGTSGDVTADIARIEWSERRRVMDCIDCHNRVGHAIPSTEQAIDESIASGRISADLPFIKRDGLALLSANYPSAAAASTAIDGLRERYRARFPLVLQRSGAKVSEAIEELKRDYLRVATPQMRVQARTYPDNLGHLVSPGCFRCHDGAHYLVVKGKLTDRTIPSTCATCHTFPEVGATVSGLLVGGQPESHNRKDFVFSHKGLVASVNPVGTSCGTCHVRTYCANCHNSGAIKVKHDVMLYRHSASVRESGVQPCAYCHNPSYCATCHEKPVLPVRPP